MVELPRRDRILDLALSPKYFCSAVYRANRTSGRRDRRTLARSEWLGEFLHWLAVAAFLRSLRSQTNPIPHGGALGAFPSGPACSGTVLTHAVDGGAAISHQWRPGYRRPGSGLDP